jgi:hypothetical protein
VAYLPSEAGSAEGRIAVLLALVSLLALHIHTPPPIPEPRVTIRETRPRLVEPVFLQQVCGGKRRLGACTKFVGYQLRLNCSVNDDRWTISGSAEFMPLIFLFNPAWLGHERSHINDMKASAERYLLDLQRQSYDTFGECEEAALNERLMFGKRMFDFAQESIRLRD